MKQKLQSSFLIAILAITILSCSKDDPKPTKTDLLVAKKWTVTKYEFKGSDVTAAYLDDCDTDDYIKFSKDGTFTESVGTLKCDTETDDSGTWAWKQNETVFSITVTGDTAEDFKFIELTATSFKVSQYDSDLQGDVTLTLVGK